MIKGLEKNTHIQGHNQGLDKRLNRIGGKV